MESKPEPSWDTALQGASLPFHRDCHAQHDESGDRHRHVAVNDQVDREAAPVARLTV